MLDDQRQMKDEREQNERMEYYLQLALNGELKLSHLRCMPDLYVGYCDNVKYNDGKYQISLSRMTKKDGQPYNNQVTVQEYKNYKEEWIIIKQFEAK